jgi:hypothetical protein
MCKITSPVQELRRIHKNLHTKRYTQAKGDKGRQREAKAFGQGEAKGGRLGTNTKYYRRVWLPIAKKIASQCVSV